MRSADSNRILLGLFVALAAGSVALKGMSGGVRYTANKPPPDFIQKRIAGVLHARGFQTFIQPLKIQSSIISAVRGNCRLSVRDARAGSAIVSVFANDARDIGPVRYLYRGESYDSPPAIKVRLGYFEANLLDMARQKPAVHIPVAIAHSQACGDDSFGLGDLQIES